jgi:hypothetical protein
VSPTALSTTLRPNGGPSQLVAITIGGDPWGIEQNVAYRLDTPQARAFLSQFVPLP